jgi:hypothetical protein
MARSLIDIGALDLRVQDSILALGTLKDFRIVLWRHEPDASGCNWNGIVERVNGAPRNMSGCEQVIPELRGLFNLIA